MRADPRIREQAFWIASESLALDRLSGGLRNGDVRIVDGITLPPLRRPPDNGASPRDATSFWPFCRSLQHLPERGAG